MQTKNIVVLMDYAGEVGSDCLKTFLENDIKISAIVCVGDKYSEKKLRILKSKFSNQGLINSFELFAKLNKN